MKIFEYSPYFNEKKALEIKLREGAKWIDELHFCEADRTYSYEPKELHFERDSFALGEYAPRVRRHLVSSVESFRPVLADQIYYDPRRGLTGFDRWYWALLTGNSAYHNEAVQRNHVLPVLRDVVEDDDIVILSDLDEILDSRLADRIVEETRRHQVITVKLHYSVFYLNLFVASNHGVPDFSYRLYVMTGRCFRTMPFTSDYLRKRGIEGGFVNEIRCLDEPAGFHHSWLEHERTAFRKLQAFAANVQDQSIIVPNYAAKCLSDRRLHYLDADLYVDNEKKFLQALQDMDTAGLWI
jgi:hypothetical protein